MPNPTSGGQGPSGSSSQRINEVNDALLSIPTYADDSMFYVIRYLAKAKEALRQVDYNEFHDTLNKLNEVALRSNEQEGGLVAKTEKMTSLKAQCLAKIEDYPDLLREFDEFITKLRIVERVVKG